jgi:hypothetical protein
VGFFVILVVLTIFVTIKEFPDRDVSKVRVEQASKNHIQDCELKNFVKNDVKVHVGEMEGFLF